jgi:predicted O-methyltransferase YrrM
MTDQDAWTAVDDYVVGLFLGKDAAWRETLARSAAAGLPDIEVSPAAAAFLGVLVRATRARRVLEIGTLGGFSTTFLARALPPGGSVLTLEIDPDHAAVARANVAEAGLGDRIEIVLGDAHATLQRLRGEGIEPFDFVFIDAEKEGYVRYLEEVLPLCRAGTTIVADNAVRSGRVAEAGVTDSMVQGVRSFNARVAAEPSLDAIVLQTVGVKGHDGLAVAVVLEDAPTGQGGER